MVDRLALDSELQQTADDFRKIIALSEQIAQDDPPEGLAAEARESLLRKLESSDRRQGRHLRLMMLQFQGSWGHGEMCLATEIRDLSDAGVSGGALFTKTDSLQGRHETIGQVPLLKLQIQGSWGHGEGCLPEPAGILPV